MDRCDALIVGGGPAGSSCAWKLRDAGFDVLLLDKKTFPRDKVCAGWVTPPVMDVLDVDLDDYQQTRVLQPITGFYTGMIGGEVVSTSFDRTVSYGIRRCEFDHYLLKRTGIKTRLGEPLKTFERRRDRWIVNGDIETPLVIGAGGHFCPVARKLGGRNITGASVVTAQEIEFEVSPNELDNCRVEPQTPQLFFCDDLAGYGWCFRKGNFLNIGLGRVDSQHLSSHVDSFCDFLRKWNRIEFEIPPKFHGHAYQLYERVQPKLLEEGVLIIGDAAGLAYPQSGEGIRPAVESGLIAAEVILHANGQYQRQQLQPYADRINDRYGRPRSGNLSNRLPAAWLHWNYQE